MRHKLLIPVVFTVGALMFSRLQGAPTVIATPFEPLDVDAYEYGNKFAEPAAITAPVFLYPYELKRSAIDGEVVVLVQIDQEGVPEKLAVLSATDQIFIRSAIDGLLKARWTPVTKNGKKEAVWFYRRVRFRISDEKPRRNRSPTSQ